MPPYHGIIAINSKPTYVFTTNGLRRDLTFNPGIFWSRNQRLRFCPTIFHNSKFQGEIKNFSVGGRIRDCSAQSIGSTFAAQFNNVWEVSCNKGKHSFCWFIHSYKELDSFISVNPAPVLKQEFVEMYSNKLGTLLREASQRKRSCSLYAYARPGVLKR